MAEACEVVEVVVAVSDYAGIRDKMVLAHGTAHVYDFVVFDGAPTLESVVEVHDEVASEAYTTVYSTASARSFVGLGREAALVNSVSISDLLRYVHLGEVVDFVDVFGNVESGGRFLVAESIKASETLVLSTSVDALSAESVLVQDTLVSNETALLEAAVTVLDYAIEEDGYTLGSKVFASEGLTGAVAVELSAEDSVTAHDRVSTFESALMSEQVSAAIEYEAVTIAVLKSVAQASEHLALGTATTQQTIERVSASVVLVGYDANVVEDWLTAVDTQQSAVRVQGQLRSEAIAQDQPVGEVDRGYFVHDQLVASESLHAEISAPLEVLVIANDHVGLGFEVVAPETAGDTNASDEMSGQGLVHTQCSEVLLASASVDFLVGTTSGVYEMLAAEYITVYDRVEVVEALDSFAWVMNSQSLAHSYYDGFVDFNSAVQLGNRAFMLSPSGLYELGGDSDDGKIIEAEVVTGQMDFGTIDRKRVEQFDLGYTAAGDLQAVVSCEGFAPSEPQTLEAREMRTAHTSRIRVGKGMVGRYWKLELKNREGADFELFNVQSKVALSTRRMR